MVDNDVTLEGKVAIVTGCNRGIGYEVARDFCRRHAYVIMGCRDQTKTASAIAKIKETHPNAQACWVHLDLASLESVRAFAQEVNAKQTRLDILVNNAGVMENSRKETEDGFELHFGVNYLGHFLLSVLLMDLMKKGEGDRRIINLTSRFHRKKFGAKVFWDDINLESNFNYFYAYCQSKLMTVMLSRHLADMLKNDEITVMVVDPGIVRTKLTTPYYTLGGFRGLYYNVFWRPYIRFRAKTARQGAESVIFCAVVQNPQQFSGRLVKNCGIQTPCSSATSPEDAKKLWNISHELISTKIV